LGKNCMLLSVVAVLCAGLGASAFAQSYPDKPIRIVVPSAPGGPTDLPARLASQILPPRLGQPVIVENRPGAAGAIGARSVATAPPDGYVLLAGNTSVFAVLPSVSASVGYDPTKNFAAVAKVSESYQILVVHPSSPWKSVKEFIDDAKANPGKLNYAHTGPGGLPHLTAELFRARTGVDIVGVAYKSGGEAVTGVLGQQIDATFESVTILLPLIRDGKLRALGITSAKRTNLAPGLPTMMEAGVPDYEVITFQRDRGAGCDACSYRWQAQQRAERGAQHARNARDHCQAWGCVATRDAGEICGLYRCAKRQVARRGARS
jgi:tripartite-type tricarboxylate transporter receptor subunit TctC